MVVDKLRMKGLGNDSQPNLKFREILLFSLAKINFAIKQHQFSVLDQVAMRNAETDCTEAFHIYLM